MCGYNNDVYSPELLDHFQNPRNTGEIADADASAQIENPVCGDVLRLSVKLHGTRIADIRFQAKGCVPTIACGSALTELVKGLTVAEARSVTKRDLTQRVGGVPPTSGHALQIAMEALQTVLKA